MRTTRRRRVRLGRRKVTLTADRLRELLHYDPSTGEFTWRAKRRGAVNAGAKAGTLKYPDRDRVQIFIHGRAYARYRLAWLYVTGAWPKDEIDHKDCNPMNDRWDNLREATRAENERNTRIRRNNSTGYKGVWFDGWKYVAQITFNYKNKTLGRYDTAHEAHVVYCRAARELFGEFARAA